MKTSDWKKVRGKEGKKVGERGLGAMPLCFGPRPRTLILSYLLALFLAGCGYYSFTGATIPEQLDTIAVPLVANNAATPITTLDQNLTDLLIDRFVGQTRLRLEPAEAEADALLQATIQRYANEPTSVSGDERATRNRVTITVAVDYADQTQNQELLQRTFSGFSEYDPLTEGLAGEEEAARAALEIVADDIFTAATSNW